MKITWTDKEITVDGEGMQIDFSTEKGYSVCCPCKDPPPVKIIITGFVSNLLPDSKP